jgi:hypothetical protein
MEVAVGLEPTKTGFAGQRLDHFGIATFENLYPTLYSKLYPNCPHIAYLRRFSLPNPRHGTRKEPIHKL